MNTINAQIEEVKLAIKDTKSKRMYQRYMTIVYHLEVITNTTPDKVGFAPNKNWTISLIIQWVSNNFNVTYSTGGMSELLYRLNLSYTRPTYTITDADVKKQEDFKFELELLKKT